MKDTRTPVRFALIRVAVSVAIGISLALLLPRALNLDPLWGVAGLTFASSIGSLLEVALLRQALDKRIGEPGGATNRIAALFAAALAAAAVAWLLRIPLGGLHVSILSACVIVLAYGLAYLLVTRLLGFKEVSVFASRLARLGRRHGN
jgi:putative peptidoglycan lipid II flippase